jgi:hypothetical protein
MTTATRAIRRTVLAGAGLLLALPAPGRAAERELSAEGLRQVHIGTRSGDVSVTGSARDSVLLRWPGGAEDAPPIERRGDRLHIGGDPEQGAGGDDALQVELPAGLAVEVSSISGELAARDLKAGCTLRSISGDIAVRAVSGGLELRAVSGDVTATEVSGDLEAKSVSGELRIEGARGGLIELKSVSGEVDLAGELGEVRAVAHSGRLRLRGSIVAGGGVRAKTFSGDLEVLLPAAADFELDAKTRSGAVAVEHALEPAPAGDQRVEGRVGKGGPELRLKSFSGDIAVRIAD